MTPSEYKREGPEVHVISQKRVKARKVHRCDLCTRTILPGETYLRRYVREDDMPKVYRECGVFPCWQDALFGAGDPT